MNTENQIVASNRGFYLSSMIYRTLLFADQLSSYTFTDGYFSKPVCFVFYLSLP